MAVDIAELKRRKKIICICRGIPLGRILDAIAQGATTLSEIQKKTTCGQGDCKGTRCTPLINEELEKLSFS